MEHSYKKEIEAGHDGFCIMSAAKSAVENRIDRGDYSFTVEQVLEDAYGFIAEAYSDCKCMFVNMKGERKIELLLCFTDDALSAMANGGYCNDSTGEVMTITLEELQEVLAARQENERHFQAEFIANEIVGEVNPVVSDTVSIPVYTLQVNGKDSSHGTYCTKWGIAYAVARELQEHGIDPEFNTGIIDAVLETLDFPSSIIAGGTVEFSTVFVADH